MKYIHDQTNTGAMVKKRVQEIVIGTLIALQIGTSSGWAATLTPADREEQNQRARQEATERQQQEQKKTVFLQPEASSSNNTSLPEEEISFQIQTIILDGQVTNQFKWLQEQLSRYKQRNIGMQGINLIVKRATNQLIDRGYITTRIAIPEQDLSKGILHLQIIPGVIHEIRFQDPSYRGNWKTAFPTRPREILNLRNLEQGLEQLKRVPSQDVDMKLVPGEQLGQSDIIITAKREKPWKLITSIDDSGSQATGKIQLSQALSIDNLFNANDLFNISLSSDGDCDGHLHGTKGNNIYYSIPNGNWTYTATKNKYDYHQTIWTSKQLITYSGTSDDFKFIAETLLARDQNSKTSLEMGVNIRNSRSYVEDTEIVVQRKDTTALTLGLVHRHHYGQTILDVHLTHKQGIPWFGAQADWSGQLDNQLTTRYHIWDLYATLRKPIRIGNIKGEYKTVLSGQFTHSKLYATDCFSIGNRYTVRGFDGEQTLSGDRGIYWQNELSLPLKQSNHQIYFGIDYGLVSGPATAGMESKELIGSTMGLRGPLGRAAQYEAFVGWPLKKPESLKTAKQVYGFQLVYQI